MPGVASVEATPATKDVVVEFDTPATLEAIKEALTKAEFPPTEEAQL
eukprot:CAMPEP_0181302974 /NCGR_PEP_ID=MMETSP1101-20121128/8295_1 /TAXON_ID=46948 /ORGANISM="Rhodomonas abbreviata, Strain Caron Lab Isolate" /LENGTH=46 /DNA_ID= /DNA_START= /DNA_END= /DNA_ORIENTATION=